MFGSVDEAKYFHFTVKMTGSNDRKLSYEGPVVSLDVDYETVIENGNCFWIGTESSLESFKTEDGFVHIPIEIRNLKEEAKDDDEESGISDEDS